MQTASMHIQGDPIFFLLAGEAQKPTGLWWWGVVWWLFFLYSVPAVSVKKLPKQEENRQGSHRLLNSAPCYHRQPHFIIPCIK